jgi:hypothetical protein
MNDPLTEPVPTQLQCDLAALREKSAAKNGAERHLALVAAMHLCCRAGESLPAWLETAISRELAPTTAAHRKEADQARNAMRYVGAVIGAMNGAQRPTEAHYRAAAAKLGPNVRPDAIKKSWQRYKPLAPLVAKLSRDSAA